MILVVHEWKAIMAYKPLESIKTESHHKMRHNGFILPWYTLAYTCRGCCTPSIVAPAQQNIVYNLCSIQNLISIKPHNQILHSSSYRNTSSSCYKVSQKTKKTTNLHTSSAKELLTSQRLRNLIVSLAICYL